MPNTHRIATFLILLAAAPGVHAQNDISQEKSAAVQASRDRYDQAVTPFFAKYCNACHGSKEPEGELELAKLDPNLESTSAARWAVVLDQLASEKMPPKDELQPDVDSRMAVIEWIKAEMKRSGKHLARREAYANGNQVSHQLLFDPQQNAPLDVPPRIRTVSPEIYAAFSGTLAKGFEGLVGQPFSPGGKSTFNDMQLARIDEPVTAQLIRNALVMVERQTGYTNDGGELKPTIGTQKDFLPFVDERRPFGEAEMEKAIRMQFARVLQREPDADELQRFTGLMKKSVEQSGRVVGVRYSLAAVFLLPEAIFRYELGSGAPDEQGRVMLSPRELASAISYALTDRGPDKQLIESLEQSFNRVANGPRASDRRAAEEDNVTIEGDSTTNAARPDGHAVKQAVAEAARRMLDDPKLQKPRILRFFREYFGYEKAVEVFKDTDKMKGHDPRALVEDTDRLIESILEQDKQVLRELLTTNKTFVAYRTAVDTKQKRAEALAKFEADKKKDPKKFEGETPNLPGRAVFESYNLDNFPDEQPIELPKDQRAGILTQPSWLVAWSTADDNHAILRGKWIRERLLGGVVPDIPITVDAQLPNAPEKTLRERMLVTHEQYCWQCHQLMNRVGLPFEMYDHFGRFRTTEPVLDPEATAKNVDAKGKQLGNVMRKLPVNATGGFEFTLDPKLTGDVKNGIEFLHKLAESEAVEQVFIRHAFRYWLGRNETLGDAASLQEAHKTYRESNGSMKELIVSLLSSDSFLYRVPDSFNRVPNGPRGSGRDEANN